MVPLSRMAYCCVLLAAVAVRYSASTHGYTHSIITQVKPENNLTSADQVYGSVPLLSVCSQLCAADPRCWSFSFDSVSHECKVSPELSNSSSQLPDDTAQVFDVTVRMYKPEICQSENILSTILNATVRDCIKLTVNSFDDAGEFAHNQEEKACYISVPMPPDSSNCQAPTVMFIGRGYPTKLAMTGSITSATSLSGMSPSAAFDRSHAPHNHWISDYGVINPWIGRDIGSVRTIAGAKFWARTNCCADQISNLHLSVAMKESDFSDYEASLCSIYPGPPDYPLMSTSEVMWLPCPFRQARYIRMTVYKTGMISVGEIEVFGFL